VTAPLVVGFVTAAVASAFSIAVVLRYVRTHSYGVFALYRLVLAAAVVALAIARSHGG
jgi:undecaprenyl-diphosphatase